MITVDETRQLPTEWTDLDLMDLFDHARHLGQNGNPAGFGLTIDLFPFVGIEEGEQRRLKPYDEWDYDGIRAYIQGHQKQLTNVWQFQVKPDWW